MSAGDILDGMLPPARGKRASLAECLSAEIKLVLDDDAAFPGLSAKGYEGKKADDKPTQSQENPGSHICRHGNGMSILEVKKE
jgi:hypothetical protein